MTNVSVKKPMLFLSLAMCLTIAATSPAATAHKKHKAHASEVGTKGDRALVVRTCQACHDINIVARAEHAPGDWPNIVRRMRTHGADITDENFDKIVHYLADKKPGVV